MEVVKKYWLAGNIDDTLKEIHQILERQDGSIPDTDALLLFAYIFYQLGNMKHAVELLSRGMAVVIVIAASGFSYKHANIFPT